jgi:DNA-binding XRE family transcriptional regulator
MYSGGTIYAIAAEGTTLVKIGSTTTAVDKRLKSLQTGQPFPLSVLAAIPVDGDVLRIERQVHAFLAEDRRRGEWFDIALDGESLAALVVRAVQFVQQQLEEEHPPHNRPWPKWLGNQLRKARIDKSLSQQELSARTGLSQKHLSALECDQMMPKWPTMVKLALELDIDLNALAWAWSRLPAEDAAVPHA